MNTFNPLAAPWQSSSFGSGLPPYYSVFDRMPLGGIWNRPQTFIYKIYEDRRPAFESRKLIKRDGCYFMKERDLREVRIAKFLVSEPTIVNPRDDGTFDCLYFAIRFEEQTEKRYVQIPYKELVRQQILPYLYVIPRNPDCPAAYIAMAFFEEMRDRDDTRFLVLPPHSGWNRDEQHSFFVSAETMIPQLSAYYAPDISARKLSRTDVPLGEAARKLNDCLPKDWRAKMLLTVSTASYLLPFYADAGYQPDKQLIVKSDSEQNAKIAATLLSTQDYSSTRTCPLTECKTKLMHELDNTHDGMCVFRDASYAENRKQREAGLDVLLQDLNRVQGLNETSRHMNAIISDNPGLYDSETPAITLCLSGCIEAVDLQKIRQKVWEFHASLVRLLETSNPNENLVTYALKNAPKAPLSVHQQGLTQTETILRLTSFILYQYNLLDEEEYQSELEFLRSDGTQAFDSDVEILNDFRARFSEWILQHPDRVVPQFGPPFDNKTAGTVIVDSDYVNLQRDPMDYIVARMRTTQRRNVVLTALKACGKLHANNNSKRMIEVETSPGDSTSLFVYSIPRSFLTAPCQAFLTTVNMADRLVDISTMPEDFLPLLCVNEDWTAGRMITETTDEAESMYVSGQTRSGKTFFLTQQAVIRAAFGNQTIIFDQTGAFSPDELRKHLPDEVVCDFFTFLEIGVDGLPVNLLSLEHCSSLPEKKQRLFSILSVIGRITGDVQGKRLRKQLPKIVRAIEAGQVRRLSDVLRFFDETDPDQAEIRNRLAEAIEDLQGLPTSQMTWSEYLAEQGKIVVISTASDGIRKSSQHIDALLASLYAWKQHHRDERMTVVLDEIEDLCLEKDGPISTILRKGGKHGLSMVLASQEFSSEKDLLGKLIGNCGMLVFFRPKDADISSIAKHISCDRQMLAGLQQGECIAKGGFFSKSKAKNTSAAITGRAFTAEQYLFSAGQYLDSDDETENDCEDDMYFYDTTPVTESQDISEETGTATGGEQE